ncbi:RidA family protein [Streptomyces sp. GbtcB6]|uniref:RidA family protein n=1 Tax=Streptomyces sp. GbtcB6 TaxID=2824751 RepID=UPI001C30D45C|nr:RidA family protein [Streptomyces sp. GbtcB6]
MPDADKTRLGRTVVQPAGHTLPIGRYSPAIAVPFDGSRSLVFVSGQVSSDAEGRVIGAGDAALQTETVFRLLAEVLKEAGGSLSDLVSVVVYLADMGDFAAVSAVRNQVLAEAGAAPSSTLVEVSSLAVADHLVEISGVAVVHGRG